MYGCKSGKQGCNIRLNEAGEPIIRLQQQWFANSGFAGELYAQYETATQYGIELEVISGSDMIDSKQVIQLGEAEIGVAGAEQVMQANEKGADLVVIGVINYKSLACFISKKEKNIVSPSDMVDKKIGTMEGTPTDMIYTALKRKLNLNIPAKNEVPTNWVLMGFLNDTYDVYPAFVNDEPITLKKQGIDLNIIYPSHSNINFIGTVYFCKRELVKNCPDIVQKFINAVSKGWELTIENPKQAIVYLKRYDSSIKEDKETESLISGLDYYRGENGNTLYASEKTWTEMFQLLKDIGQITKFDYAKTVDDKFVAWYLTEEK